MSATTETTVNRLCELRSLLVELFILEANPDRWPMQPSKEAKLDRLRVMRNAEATGRLAMRAFQLTELVDLANVTAGMTAEEKLAKREAVDRDIEETDRRAMALLRRSGIKGIKVVD